MNKLFLKAIILIALFFSSWFILSRIDWMTVFKVEHLTKTTEEKLGDLYWEMLSSSEKVIQSRKVTLPLDSILSKICISNNIDKSKIKLHVVESSEINAFALPDNHLVIFSNLILTADNEAELAGIICHELAHIEKKHVMRKLIKEVGLSVLTSIVTENHHSQMVKQTAKILSSTAYDRNLEKEADIKAVDYLLKANIDPESFANFLYKLAESEPDIQSDLTWISTHPDTKARAGYIIEYSSSSGKSKKFKPILAQATWDKMEANLDY